MQAVRAENLAAAAAVPWDRSADPSTQALYRPPAGAPSQPPTGALSERGVYGLPNVSPQRPSPARLAAGSSESTPEGPSMIAALQQRVTELDPSRQIQLLKVCSLKS